MKLSEEGELEYLARIDDQVKIRGYRIELGEIENQLLKHSEIKEAVVLAKADEKKDKYLCAYFLSDKELSASELRDYLSKDLPDYMIPSFFMPLETLPLTPNGKVNRKALPDPVITAGSKYIVPRNEMEVKLVGIWSEVLGIEKSIIGIDNNFFELGGQSLKATILVAKIHKEFNVKLPLAKIFIIPTVLGLAKYITETVGERYLEIKSAEKKEYYSLSSAQKRLYLLLQMDPASTVYNMASAVILEGKLENERMEETFKKLIMRHESLRTSFHMIEESPAQVIHDYVDFEIGYDEIETEDEDGANTEIQNFIRDTSPFDLSRAPLMKVGLIKSEEMRHYLKFDMQHIISDGTSSAIFINEFMALYEGRELPLLRIQYKDYSEWQTQEKEKARIKKQEEYWLKTFERQVPVLNLPADYSRWQTQNFEGKRVFFEISAGDTAALNRLAMEQETTLYTVLLSLYYVLLHKLSHQEYIVIGAPTAGRIHDDLQNTIGIFLNTLSIKNCPQPGKTFTCFLNEVRNRVFEAFENQEYQFEDLVDKLGVKRNTGRNPLFDVMFILQNMEMPGIEISGLNATPTGYLTDTTKFDLSLYAVESGQKIDLIFNYRIKRFERATVEVFIKYFKNILSSVLRNPGMNISDIEYVSDEERAVIVEHFNRDLRQEAETVLAGRKVLQEKLNEIFTKYKNHTAIEYETKILTYSELDRRSNYIAHWIVHRGIKKETFIGILIEDRAELISTVLGIIKAGCVFVSLDSSYPNRRLEIMMETTRMKIIMVDKTNNQRFSTNYIFKKQKVEPRLLERLFLNAHLNPSWFVHPPAVRYGPEDRQYILFTSGTTGRPKAVMGRNSGLLHYTSWEIKRFDIGNGFRVGQLAIPSFDPFLRDTFVPLCSGGVVCIPGNKDIVLDPIGLRMWLEKARIQMIHCVPSLFKLINSAPLTAAHFKDLKFILLAGEKVVPSVLAAWYEIFDERIRLVNLLGPTETTLAKICYLICKSDVNRVRIPVGKPIEGAAVIILDDNLNVCGPLEKGEICIRTPFKSCGYFGDDQLNKIKFIQNPFSNEPDDILYRTGDMGRFLPDGKLDFLGREDRQVKIRGRRIEMEEIENMLLRHPAVKEAVVVKKETANNDELLCAYIAKKPHYADDEKLLTATLPDYLVERLPDFMVPSNMVEIEKIPRNINGKVDYRRLPDPFAERERELSAPRDEIENRLLKVWSQLLKFEAIGITDNFFSTGGSSLTAMHLTYKIHKEFDVTLVLEDVFKNPTIEEQAKLIRGATKDKYTSIENVSEREYYALSSAQKRLYVVWSMNPETTAYNLFKAVILEGRLDRGKLEKIFKKLTQRHESFRTSFLIKDGKPVQAIHKEAALHIRYINARGNEEGSLGKELDKIIGKLLVPFDLSRAPLLRVGIIEIQEKKHVLVVDIHHIISDGTSLGILVKDFMKLYRGEALPPLRLQYKDYSQWQTGDQQQEVLKIQENFWLKQFEGEIPLLDLPTDYSRSDIRDFVGSKVHFEISSEERTALHKIVHDEVTTMFMVLLAIYYIFLSKICSQEDIVIGTDVAGRSHADMENIIGMFVNTLALRNFPTAEKSFKAFLQELKERTIKAFENQDYQFDDLVKNVPPHKDAGRNPVFDVMFSFMDIKVDEGEFQQQKNTDLILKNYPYENRTAKFDLMLNGREELGHLFLSFDYSTGLFKKETIGEYVTYFKEIVSSIIKNPYARIWEIEMVSEAEEKRLLGIVKEDQDRGLEDVEEIQTVHGSSEAEFDF
ncbi:amino acid adenylation domain-containing protein [Acidobacteriota bacterium]